MDERGSAPRSSRAEEPATATDAAQGPPVAHGVEPPSPAAAGGHAPQGAGRTRTSAAWVGLIAAAVVLVLLLVFILQNLGSVQITYFTATGSFPLGAALLLAAVGGVLLTGLVASLRILQLRRRIRRRDRATQSTAVEPSPVED